MNDTTNQPFGQPSGFEDDLSKNQPEQETEVSFDLSKLVSITDDEKLSGTEETEPEESAPEPEETEPEELAPEPGEEEEEEEEEEEGEDDKVSPGVQKRFDELTRARREEERRRIASEQELLALRQRLSHIEQNNAQRQNQTIEQAVVQTEQEIKDAIESGDTERQISLNNKLMDLRIHQRTSPPPAAPNNAPNQQSAPPAPPLAMDWWSKNQWFNSPGYEQQTIAARSIDVILEAEGMDKNDPGYYKELNHRISKLYPELVDDPGPVQPAKRRKGRRKKSSRSKDVQNTVAPRSNMRQGSGNRRYRFTADQISMAESLGINTEEGLREFAAEIRAQREESNK